MKMFTLLYSERTFESDAADTVNQSLHFTAKDALMHFWKDHVRHRMAECYLNEWIEAHEAEFVELGFDYEDPAEPEIILTAIENQPLGFIESVCVWFCDYASDECVEVFYRITEHDLENLARQWIPDHPVLFHRYGQSFQHVSLPDLINDPDVQARVEDSASEGICVEVVKWSEKHDAWQRYAYHKELDNPQRAHVMALAINTDLMPIFHRGRWVSADRQEVEYAG